MCKLELAGEVSQGTVPCWLREDRPHSQVVSPSSGLVGFLLTLSALKLKSLVAPGQCAAWLLMAQVREEAGEGLGWTQCSQSWHRQLYSTESVLGAGPSPDPAQVHVCASSSCSRPGRRGAPSLS